MTQATGAVYDVHFRRRRQGRTDYAKRLSHLKSGKTRLIVRKTNKFVLAAFADFSEKGDLVRASKSSRELKQFGFPGKCNTPSAYLTGYWLGREAKKKGVTEAILDIGLHPATKGGLLFAALKGAIDAGIQLPFGEEILPSGERISGAHLKGETAKQFEECKKKIDAT